MLQETRIAAARQEQKGRLAARTLAIIRDEVAKTLEWQRLSKRIEELVRFGLVFDVPCEYSVLINSQKIAEKTAKAVERARKTASRKVSTPAPALVAVGDNPGAPPGQQEVSSTSDSVTAQQVNQGVTLGAEGNGAHGDGDGIAPTEPALKPSVPANPESHTVKTRKPPAHAAPDDIVQPRSTPTPTPPSPPLAHSASTRAEVQSVSSKQSHLSTSSIASRVSAPVVKAVKAGVKSIRRAVKTVKGKLKIPKQVSCEFDASARY